jgi:ParB family chromosome partitioning protein
MSMKNEISSKAENRTKAETVPPRAQSVSDRGVTRIELSPDSLVPDPNNRAIDEGDEEFATLLDSIRVMGVLAAVQAQRRSDGTLQLIDGERRWRAARRAGLATVPCDVWPESTHPRDVTLAGVILNEQRQAHSCLAVARRLRAVKNQFAETHEQVAARTGLPVKRITSYMQLFNASDRLLSFFEEENVSLKTAVELVRYEKSLGEVATRRLLERHADEPLTARDIEILRKRTETRSREEDASAGTPSTRPRIANLVARMETVIREDPSSARKFLDEVAAKLGLRLIEVVSAPSS